MHSGCSGMKGRLLPVVDYKYRKCTIKVRPLEGLIASSVVVRNESFVFR